MMNNETSDNSSIVIFRRDLRLNDNSALISAIESSNLVLPVFIYDSLLLTSPNKSKNAIQFMQESIKDLEAQLERVGGKLFLFEGKPWVILDRLLSDHQQNFTSIFLNRDYTPYSQKRDNLLAEVAQKRNVRLRIFSDLLLNEPETILKKDGTPYTVFTPYYNRATENIVLKPKENPLKGNFLKINDFAIIDSKNELISNPHTYIKGGRHVGLKILSKIDKFDSYEIDRDFPAKESTTNLSAHLNFGTISIRETFHRFYDCRNIPLLRQLYWRDFYHYIGFHFPFVYKSSFREKYRLIQWFNDKEKFKLWTEGKTGFPIIDAGMRQLNQTGFMHNRVRMIVASFLTKDLHINWQWGERYFAQRLIDYNISVNNGNWQWSSGTGCDAVPYFRIFNPWTQQRKFDPEGEYIKKYIPELRDLDTQEIHNLEKSSIKDLGYPRPIVNHFKARKQAIMMFQNLNEV